MVDEASDPAASPAAAGKPIASMVEPWLRQQHRFIEQLAPQVRLLPDGFDGALQKATAQLAAASRGAFAASLPKLEDLDLFAGIDVVGTVSRHFDHMRVEQWTAAVQADLTRFLQHLDEELGSEAIAQVEVTVPTAGDTPEVAQTKARQLLALLPILYMMVAVYPDAKAGTVDALHDLQVLMMRVVEFLAWLAEFGPKLTLPISGPPWSTR